MKKLSLILALLLLMPLWALGEETAYRTAVVANHNVADRLILRSKPSTSGKVLGRMYSGTPVTILSDDGEWCKVQLGDLTGYMMTGYLAYEIPDYSLPRLFYTARTEGKLDAPIYGRASTSGQVLTNIAGYADVYVLGDINDDWRYVLHRDQYGREHYGYMRSTHLNKTLMNVEALVYGSIYSDKNLKKETGARLYGNARAKVTEANRNSGWAKIEVLDAGGSAWQGYVAQNQLNIFSYSWQSNWNYIRTGKVTSSLSLVNRWQDQPLLCPAGTTVIIQGEDDNHYFVELDGYMALVEKHLIPTVEARHWGQGSTPYLGFALLRPGDERLWSHNALSRIIGDTGDQYQLEELSGSTPSFMDKENVLVLMNEDLRKYDLSLPEGAFTVDATHSAIWHFVVQEGCLATLSMENEIWNIHIENKQFTEGSYSYYLPEGTKGTLSGAVWSCEEARTPDIKLYTCFPEEALDIAFQGSARYYCDWQISYLTQSFGYCAQPIPGSEESYFIISSLNSLDGEKQEYKVDLYHLEGEEDNCFHLLPGEFVEMKNCILYYNFGHG